MTHTTTQAFELTSVQKKFKNQRGLTLVELLAALAVVAAVVAGALALYNAASTSQSSTQLLQDVTSIRGAVKSIWAGQGNYGTDSLVPTLVQAGRLPTTVRVSGSGAEATLAHVLGGAVTIVGATNTFDIGIEDVRKDVCISLSTGTTSWSAVSVNGDDQTLPLTPAAAAAACSGDTNDIVFSSN
jgi:prepilin-type N-terminal cleavage/methylation domain-containing protein